MKGNYEKIGNSTKAARSAQRVEFYHRSIRAVNGRVKQSGRPTGKLP